MKSTLRQSWAGSRDFFKHPVLELEIATGPRTRESQHAQRNHGAAGHDTQHQPGGTEHARNYHVL